MIKFITGTILLLGINLICIAQNSTGPTKLNHARSVKRSQPFNKSPYNKKDIYLVNSINSLKYDSVKVFYFNQEKNDVIDFSLSVDTPSFYNKMFRDTMFADKIRGSRTTDKGKLLTKQDSYNLLKIFANAYKDSYTDDPISAYVPTIGFVFFRKDVACAHIEVSLITASAQLEVSDNNKKPYGYNWVVIGRNTYSFIKLLAQKYKLPNWAIYQ